MQELLDQVKAWLTDCTLVIPKSKTYFYISRWDTVLSLWYNDWAFGTYYISSVHKPSKEYGSWSSRYSDTIPPTTEQIESILQSEQKYRNKNIQYYKNIEEFISKNSWLTYETISL